LIEPIQYWCEQYVKKIGKSPTSLIGVAEVLVLDVVPPPPEETTESLHLRMGLVDFTVLQKISYGKFTTR